MSASEVGWYLWSPITWLSAEGRAGTRVNPGRNLGPSISGGFPCRAGCARAGQVALRGVRWGVGVEPGQRQAYRGDTSVSQGALRRQKSHQFVFVTGRI